MIREIVDDQRTAVRETLIAGMREGRNPRSTALDIVGRVSRETQRRTGGIIGITSHQAQYVANARRQLLSDNPEDLRAYLERKRRDRRFDRLVLRAIREGRAVSPVDVEKMLGKYSDRLLALRGEMLARTETLTSFGAAQFEAALQLIDSGAVRADQVRLVWRSAGDGRVRDSHVSLNGQQVRVGEPFVSPLTGAMMRYPGDIGLGAPGADIVGCRCRADIHVDHLASVKAA